MLICVSADTPDIARIEALKIRQGRVRTVEFLTFDQLAREKYWAVEVFASCVNRHTRVHGLRTMDALRQDIDIHGSKHRRF